MSYADSKNKPIAALLKAIYYLCLISLILGIINLAAELVVSETFRQNGILITHTVIIIILLPLMIKPKSNLWLGNINKFDLSRQFILIIVMFPFMIIISALLLWLVRDDYYTFITMGTVFGLPVSLGSSLTTISYILTVISYVLVKNEIKKELSELPELPAHLKKSAIAKRKRDTANYTRLIKLVGKKFFVKYYYKLRDFSQLDIVDEITEDYSESAKRSRINNGKKIFKLGLEKFSLNEIANNSNEKIDEETRQKARKILEEIK